MDNMKKNYSDDLKVITIVIFAMVAYYYLVELLKQGSL